MAMSLEELLVGEGFDKGKLRISSRKSLPSESKNVVPVSASNRVQRRPSSAGSSSSSRRTGRTRSDVARHRTKGENVKNPKSKDNSLSQEKEPKLKRQEQRQNHERKSSKDSFKGKKFSVDSVESSSVYEVIDQNAEAGEITDTKLHENGKADEITEVKLLENGMCNKVYTNDAYNNEGSHDNDMGFQENVISYKPPAEKEIQLDNGLDKNTSMNTIFDKHNTKSMKQTETSNRNSQNIKEKKIQKNTDIEQDVGTPALDEAAILALISLLTGYAKCFLKDDDFRSSLVENTFASLNFTGNTDAINMESKVIENLKDAIEIVEKAAEEHTLSKELKKASLQLSVITGLNCNEMKDGFTCNIPNYKLSACAHLYLSVIYVLHKKDRIAAKHLLRVLCDWPFQARTVLLTDLWDQIFGPHFSELKIWFRNETESLENSPSKAKKHKLIEETYNEILDSSTYQLAAYYKDWLTEGYEAPTLPSVQIPRINYETVEDEEQDDYSHETVSPVNSLPSQPIVSRKLYDEVFKHSTVKGSEEFEFEVEESSDISARSSHYAVLEDNNSSSETVKQTILDVKYDLASHPEDEEAERIITESTSENMRSNDLFGYRDKKPGNSENMTSFHALQPAEMSEMILKRLSKSVFQRKISDNSIESACPVPDSMPTKSGSVFEENEAFFSSVPEDFVCPLTELLFEDPVTLETGHTFERSALMNWFDRGNITCPVTGITLEYQSIPRSNLILKRVIDSWKSEYYRRLMDLTSKLNECMESKDETAVFILEQLMMVSSEEEKRRNALHIVTEGGLQFIVYRFRIGNMEEKTRVSALLLYCIMADADCRKYICSTIDRISLLDLLHSEQLKSRMCAISLLTEIVCLNRRKDAMCFLDGLQREETLSALHVLLMLLQCCEPEQKPLVAVLLLHFDLLVEEPQNYRLYRGEAVDAITAALESSLFDDGVQENCCRALLVLGGHFSSAGKLMTEDWILKQAGFLDCPVFDSPEHEEATDLKDRTVAMRDDFDEDRAREKWLVNLSVSFLEDGNKSFLEAVSTCLMSEFPDLVRVCLTTVAWLSSALASLSDPDFQLSVFSALIHGLKICLEHGELVEHRVLASISLLNFSKFPECRLLLMTMAEDIALPLENLSEETWTAKELYALICT